MLRVKGSCCLTVRISGQLLPSPGGMGNASIECVPVAPEVRKDVLLPQKFTAENGKTANPAIILGSCKDVTIKIIGRVRGRIHAS